MKIQTNGNCSIDFTRMLISKNPPSLENALSSVTPFELSQDVIDGKTKITVDINKELMKDVR